MGLTQTSYDPQGPIAGPHAQGYGSAPDGTLADTTAQAPFKGADGAVVSNAAGTATFLRALLGGRLVDRQRLVALWGSGADSGCGRGAYVGSGAGSAYKPNVLVNGDGSRIAVLLLNGRTANGRGDPTAAAAALGLYAPPRPPGWMDPLACHPRAAKGQLSAVVDTAASSRRQRRGGTGELGSR